MNSGSVWIKQTDTALVKRLDEVVRTIDEQHLPIKVEVLVQKPEKEFSVEKYPCVSIFNYDQRFDIIRYEDTEVITGKDLARGVASTQPSAKPYTLFYQVSFWAKYLEDINEMTRTWLENVKPFDLLEVVDTKGNTRFSNMTQIGFRNLDDSESKDSDRTFRRVYSYKLWVELDSEVTRTTPIVKEVNLKGEK